MGHDPFSPTSLAQINVLCLPASEISRKAFAQCVRALKTYAVNPIRYGSGKNADDGNSTSHGWVLLNITDSLSEDNLAGLYPFENNRRPQIIIGIVPGGDASAVQSKLDADSEQSFISIFKTRIASYKHMVSASVIQFGESPNEGSREFLHIVDAQNTTAISDALSEIVSAFQRSLPGFLEQLRDRAADLDSLNGSIRRMSISSSTSTRQDKAAVGDGRSHEASESANREAIAFGIYHLQAGQWSNALRLLSEGSIGSRTSTDYLWHARGLEGLLTCMLLMAWAQVDFKVPQVCLPTNERHNHVGHSSSMDAILNSNRPNSASLFGNTSAQSPELLNETLPHLIGTIIGLYERAVNNLNSTVPFLVLCEARVRWLNLFVLLKTNGGALSIDCMRSIVGDGLNSDSQPGQKPSGSTLVLKKTTLSLMLVDASLEAQAKLPIETSAPLQFALAKCFSSLGIERKQGFHLKQFLQRLIPALVEARRRGAAEIGVHPASNLQQINLEESGESDDHSRGIENLLRFVADAYDLPSGHALLDMRSLPPVQRLRANLEFWYAAHTSGDLFIKLEILGICIEISDALPDPRSSLLFTSYLLQASRQSVVVIPRNDESAPLISPQDLPRILQNIHRNVSSAESLGINDCRSEYWDKYLVRGMTLLQDSGSNRLMPHTAYDLSVAASADSEAKKDPFIFNPFAKPKVGKGESIVSIGDILCFNVVLQNPLEVEVEIEDITILTDGCQFRPVSHSIVLGPHCLQDFILSGVPEASGQLKVIGCRATIRGCYQEDFLILPKEWHPPYRMKQNAQSNSRDIKPALDIPEAKDLLLKVIDPLPLLSVASSSLMQPSLMLIDGERTQIELTLRNDSPIDIDFITITSDDSVKQLLEEGLGNKDLSPADTYEVQLQIIRKPAVKLLNLQSGLRIEAGKCHTFELQIMGKPGLTYVTILIDYAFLGKSRSQITETFYTRQLHYSIATTVNGGVDITRCMIMPFQGDATSLIQSKLKDDGGKPLTDRGGNACMLLLDMRNLWPHPLEVTFRASDSADGAADDSDNQQAYAISELLQPGQVTRVVVLVPRIFVSDARAVIPNLDTRRQFVVSASKLSLEAEVASRESFWYRERLLACLEADWKDEFGSRKGQVDLRKGLRLNARMIEALRIDPVDISFFLRPDPQAQPDATQPDSVKACGTSHYALTRNQFAVLVTRVHNRGDSDLQLLLRLQPSLRNQLHNVALELSKRFVWSGTLQQALHPPLRAGEIRELELGVLVLANGEYEVNGLVEEIEHVPLGGTSAVKGLGGSDERCIWHSRQPCQIDVLSNIEEVTR